MGACILQQSDGWISSEGCNSISTCLQQRCYTAVSVVVAKAVLACHSRSPLILTRYSTGMYRGLRSDSSSRVLPSSMGRSSSPPISWGRRVQSQRGQKFWKWWSFSPPWAGAPTCFCSSFTTATAKWRRSRLLTHTHP